MESLDRMVLELMREQFDDDDLEIDDATTATDVPGWDSLAHVNLIVAVEKATGVRFAAGEIGKLRGPGENVGSFMALLRTKLASHG